MVEADDSAQAEKLANARKRFEQIKKQKGKGGKSGGSKKKEDKEESKNVEIATAADSGDVEQVVDAPSDTTEAIEDVTKAEDDAIKDDTIDIATLPGADPKGARQRQPSLSAQSKIRSSSFRRASLSQGPLSPSNEGLASPESSVALPDNEPINSIYRKQAGRLDELEKDNERLSQEVKEAEKKWRKSEEEVEELRESSGDVAELKAKAQRLETQAEELSKAKQENTSLQRQISQLQSQSSKRHASSPSQSGPAGSMASLQSQLDSKTSTIETMEMEISSLRSQIEKTASSSASHGDQVSALEAKLDRAEQAASTAQRELLDVKKSLDRASEKAVRESTDKTSSEMKMRNLERDATTATAAAEESARRIEALEKKLSVLTNMHKDVDARRQTGDREREKLDTEAAEMRRKFAGIENENLRLRDERERARKREASGTDDEGMDELENDERTRLEKKVRDLEGEVYDLRRGVWRERRKTLQGNMDEAGFVDGPASPAASKFDDIDLNGGSGMTPSRHGSVAKQTSSSITDVLSSGISAFTGSALRGTTVVNDGLQDFDDDGFDEDAFRLAQEEEGRKRIERIKEIKRGLKEWEGWRMDLVDVRKAGNVGFGEIFDV